MCCLSMGSGCVFNFYLSSFTFKYKMLKKLEILNIYSSIYWMTCRADISIPDMGWVGFVPIQYNFVWFNSISILVQLLCKRIYLWNLRLVYTYELNPIIKICSKNIKRFGHFFHLKKHYNNIMNLFKILNFLHSNYWYLVNKSNHFVRKRIIRPEVKMMHTLHKIFWLMHKIFFLFFSFEF